MERFPVEALATEKEVNNVVSQLVEVPVGDLRTVLTALNLSRPKLLGDESAAYERLCQLVAPGVLGQEPPARKVKWSRVYGREHALIDVKTRATLGGVVGTSRSGWHAWNGTREVKSLGWFSTKEAAQLAVIERGEPVEVER